MDQGIIKQLEPNIVPLMIGTNDISQNIDLVNAPHRLGKTWYVAFRDALRIAGGVRVVRQ